MSKSLFLFFADLTVGERACPSLMFCHWDRVDASLLISRYRVALRQLSASRGFVCFLGVSMRYGDSRGRLVDPLSFFFSLISAL
jgi:hypothetical protein